MVNIRNYLIQQEGFTDKRILDNLPEDTDELFTWQLNFKWRPDYEPDRDSMIMNFVRNKDMLHYVYFEDCADGLIAITPEKAIYWNRVVTPAQHAAKYGTRPLVQLKEYGAPFVSQFNTFRLYFAGERLRSTFTDRFGRQLEVWETAYGLKTFLKGTKLHPSKL